MNLRISVTCLLGLLFLSACSDDHPIVGYYPRAIDAGYIARPVSVTYPAAYPVRYPTYAYPVQYYPYTPDYRLNGCTRYPWPNFYSAYTAYPFYWRWRTSWSHWPLSLDPYRLRCNFNPGRAGFYDEVLGKVSHNISSTPVGWRPDNTQTHALKIGIAQMVCDDRTYEKKIAQRLLPPPGMKVDWSEDAHGLLKLQGHRATPLTGEMNDDGFELSDRFEDEDDSLVVKVAERVTGVVTDSGSSALSQMGIEVASTADPNYQANCLLTSAQEFKRLGK